MTLSKAPASVLAATLAQHDVSTRVLSREEEAFTLACNELVTVNPAMLEFKRKLIAVARSILSKNAQGKLSTLILGESGTGKELAAKILHGTRAGPFIPINCSSLPENLFESELFGYVRGAFTGANTDRQGVFAAAQHGTVFLDEIGDIPISQQAKLLRVLQSRTVTRLGSTTSTPINCQIVCATNQNLIEMVKCNQFREDLYYRIAIICLKTIPLRDRPEDVMPIFNAVQRRLGLTITADVPPLEVYQRGNVRALESFALANEILL